MIRRSPTLTEQAKTALKERILAGQFVDGRMPSESDLAVQMGVSRATVRSALSRLENEGVVLRKQGAGTFVNPTGLQVKTRLEEIWSYEAMMEAHGYTPSTHILSVVEEIASAELAADLNLPLHTPILTIHKLFTQDDTPAILTINHIPCHQIIHAYDDTVWHEPVFVFLRDYCGQTLSYYLSDVVPIVTDDSVAELLAIAPGTPLISFEEVGYGDDNRPIIKSFSYFRDDLLRLRLIRRDT
jgi:GntR family transcriptional regulator